jgi:hypothetical protein
LKNIIRKPKAASGVEKSAGRKKITERLASSGYLASDIGRRAARSPPGLRMRPFRESGKRRKRK